MHHYTLRIEKDHTDADQDIKFTFDAANHDDAREIAEAKASEALPAGWTAWCTLFEVDTSRWERGENECKNIAEFEIN